jgi:hypothetical protein
VKKKQNKKLHSHSASHSVFVPQTGLEPVRPYSHRILSPACLPIPPPGRVEKKIGQVSDLSGRRDSNPRPQPWQGCALPTELLSLICQYFIELKKPLFSLSGRKYNNKFKKEELPLKKNPMAVQKN